MNDQIEPLAERLMAEGHYDNQADARLAAIHIILAASRVGPRDDDPLRSRAATAWPS